ncbi:hypothetical protein GWN26_06960, partial [Candidatus Saccharibacteria bacterium]|nr:hypothetical protein [Candidatus Saccharibacteria bacterium]NIV03745.1 hypothetical protein [Calditrichia bacterium]NIS38262.1 hypothetical protein [Candidatus Saccharibacteria bacterium]NIV72042.1 hypothetical protein [Calditrichia bacterium]NIV98890.1 hypothetical protein [Candidatus Saccharibacteria bacterium]
MIKKKFLLIIIPLTVVLTLAAYIGIGYAVNGLQASKVSVKANLFNGSGFEWCMIYGYGSEYLCDMFYGTFANDKVIMKWNDEWARGEAENWANP